MLFPLHWPVPGKIHLFHLHESETSVLLFLNTDSEQLLIPLLFHLPAYTVHCIQDASYKSRRKSAGHSFVHMQQAQNTTADSDVFLTDPKSVTESNYQAVLSEDQSLFCP